MVEQMKPLIYDFWPEISVWENIKDSVGNAIGKGVDWFKNAFSRRLVGTGNYPVLLMLDGTG